MTTVVMIGDCHAIGWKVIAPRLWKEHNIKWYFYYGQANGNQWMNGILFEHLENIGKPDHVYIMFSDLTKLDKPLHHEHKISNYEYQTAEIKKNWVQSGGWQHSWRDHNETKKLFQHCYDRKDPTYTHNLSWQSIFSAIELCKSLKISYQWNFYYDLENPPNEHLEKWFGKSIYPSYIDRSHELKDQPLNWAYRNEMAPADGSHYNAKVNHGFLLEHLNKFSWNI